MTLKLMSLNVKMWWALYKFLYSTLSFKKLCLKKISLTETGTAVIYATSNLTEHFRLFHIIQKVLINVLQL